MCAVDDLDGGGAVAACAAPSQRPVAPDPSRDPNKDQAQAKDRSRALAPAPPKFPSPSGLALRRAFGGHSITFSASKLRGIAPFCRPVSGYKPTFSVDKAAKIGGQEGKKQKKKKHDPMLGRHQATETGKELPRLSLARRPLQSLLHTTSFHPPSRLEIYFSSSSTTTTATTGTAATTLPQNNPSNKQKFSHRLSRHNFHPTSSIKKLLAVLSRPRLALFCLDNRSVATTPPNKKKNSASAPVVIAFRLALTRPPLSSPIHIPRCPSSDPISYNSMSNNRV
ncbi:hypothetical protein B0J13DRAFT_519775 [Dactylonectria estremocensis]|uniref:Uncharacterized protein n=1 Tax=Dactylonectria estremocensis TaxID=1079267 RepID=A0A9P9FG74_9HYPO|nr:hypothetical protein B0J13DRAFT_519775 [Dactylonectria estremocensis]